VFGLPTVRPAIGGAWADLDPRRGPLCDRVSVRDRWSPCWLPRRLLGGVGCRARRRRWSADRVGRLLTATQFAHDGVSDHCGCGVPCRARFWRPDPRHGAEPREPSYADWTSPAETGCRAASAPRHFAPAVRVGLPSTESLSGDFTALGEPPERVHADVVAAPEVIHSSAATNLTPSCAQNLAVNSPSGQPPSSSPTVTAARPLAFRSSRTPGRASMVS